MEVYTLDDLLRRQAVFDQFESLIWTERFVEEGDFELVIRSTHESRGAFVTNTFLAMNESYRVMRVDTVEDSVDTDGKATLTVKGLSIESIFRDRVAQESLGALKYPLVGTPANIARQVFADICVTKKLDINDGIPFYVPGNFFPTDTIGEPTAVVPMVLDPMTLYDALIKILKPYDLGFRLVRQFDTSKVYFNVYSGSDRTSSQSTLPAVVFSPDLENLQNTTALSTAAGAKNVAYVYSDYGNVKVYPLTVDPDVDGFERRILLVKADIEEGTPAPEAAALMTQIGEEELANHRAFSAFDGELNQHSTYRYGVDYQLGDLVELRNVDGATNNMRVTEQIFVSDSEGERSYPTLAINLFITPGSWIAWDYNQVWADLGPTEYWADA